MSSSWLARQTRNTPIRRETIGFVYSGGHPMKHTTKLYLVLFAVALQLPFALAVQAAPSPLPIQSASAADGVPGRYIITMKPGRHAQPLIQARGLQARRVFARSHAGFVADLSAAQLEGLRRAPDVAAIEQDRRLRMQGLEVVGSESAWGIDRIDQRSLPLSYTYSYESTGAGVNVYILDSGIDVSLPEFGGRASVAYDVLGGDGLDCHGHGTHVAGTIGSATYGVAKQANLHAVRVLDCDGTATVAELVDGITWVANNHLPMAVANISIGGDYSAAINAAVADLVASGVFVVVAAGNETRNACNVSPASAPAAYTVAAVDKKDVRSLISNYGSCVDAYAPGVAIKSTWPGDTAKTLSGTSMSAAHVTGVAALYKATYGDVGAATICAWLDSHAVPNVIKSNRIGTPNLLLNMVGL
ncbi:S8 family peptidase [Chloroflexia bacterium SDU3-3]|nr:S8 family peptidase [Chloroflexia bacterium SDU3-3]